jgi:DNA-binding CsgD family transcriptional regulator
MNDPAALIAHVEQQLATPLSLIEAQLLLRASNGSSLEETSQALGLDPNSVKLAGKHVIRKLGAVNLTQAVAIALRGFSSPASGDEVLPLSPLGPRSRLSSMAA